MRGVRTFSNKPVAEFYAAANVTTAMQGCEPRVVKHIRRGTVFTQQLCDVQVIPYACEVHTVGAVGVTLIWVLASLREQLLYLRQQRDDRRGENDGVNNTTIPHKNTTIVTSL